MKYKIIKRVSPCDLDVNSKPFPSFYLRCMQETAHMHMTDYPPSPEKLRDEHGRAFVLSRAVISVYRDLSACDEIESETWASPTHGVSFPRSLEIRINGEIAAKIASVWALVDTVNHGICRPEDYPCSYTTEPPLEADMNLRFRIPRDAELKKVGEYIPNYADIDLNGHVNNTRYPDILFGFIPELQDRRFKDIGICYLHEAYLGQSLKIYLSDLGETCYMRSVRPDGQVNVEMQIIFDKKA